MSEDLANPAPKLISIGQLSWTAQWIAGVEAKLGVGFRLDENGSLHIDPDVDQGRYNAAASFLWKTRERSSMVIRVTNRILGELILNYAATFSVGWTDAIEALSLGTEKTMSSLKKLPRIVSRLPSDVLSLEGLTHSHFDVATSFSGPEEPDQQREWNLRIRKILMEAAECPEDRPSKWVGDSIRALQKEFGIEPARPIGGKVLLDQYATLCYILEHWTEDQFADAGHERRKILDHRDSIENDLINRGILTIPDCKNFVPPWRHSTADSIDVLEPEEEAELAPFESLQPSEDQFPSQHAAVVEEPPPPQLRVVPKEEPNMPDDDDLPSLEDDA